VHLSRQITGQWICLGISTVNKWREAPRGWTEGKETSSGWKDWEIKIVQITGSVGSLG